MGLREFPVEERINFRKAWVLPKNKGDGATRRMPSEPKQSNTTSRDEHSEETNGKARIADRFVGALLGSAIGDALAFPYRHYSHAFLTSLFQSLGDKFGQHHSGHYPVGQYSDDTQVALAIGEAILASKRDDDQSSQLDAGHFFRYILPLWRDQVLSQPDPSCAEAMNRVLASERLWIPQPHGEGRAEVAPVGRVLCSALYCHDDAERRRELVESLVQLTHSDPRPLACAAAFAAAIAHNLNTRELILGPFLDDVAQAAGSFDPRIETVILDFPRILSMTQYRCLRRIGSLCPDPKYPASEEGATVYCVPALLLALYYFLKNPYDYSAAILNGLRIGGEHGTTVFLLGGLSGALVGQDGLPAPLKEAVLASEAIERLGKNLYRQWQA